MSDPSLERDAPLPIPAPPNNPSHNPAQDDDQIPTINLKRIAKIAAIVFLYFIARGAVAGFHAAFSALNGQDFLGLSPFWHTVVTNTANGAVDGFMEAFRLVLVCWAGPDVINIVGPVIGSAWRRAASAVRQMSRALQGKPEFDPPVDSTRK